MDELTLGLFTGSDAVDLSVPNGNFLVDWRIFKQLSTTHQSLRNHVSATLLRLPAPMYTQQLCDHKLAALLFGQARANVTLMVPNSSSSVGKIAPLAVSCHWRTVTKPHPLASRPSWKVFRTSLGVKRALYSRFRIKEGGCRPSVSPIWRQSDTISSPSVVGANASVGSAVAALLRSPSAGTLPCASKQPLRDEVDLLRLV